MEIKPYNALAQARRCFSAVALQRCVIPELLINIVIKKIIAAHSAFGEHMKEPTFSAAYAAFYPMLAELSQENGYALAIHGSVVSDFDLVAVPWTKEAASADTLITSIANYAGMFSADKSKVLLGPEEKEHGRKAWSLLMPNGAVIDFSIMPMLHNA